MYETFCFVLGNTCQTQIDECASIPCQNAGTCVDQVNGFNCICLAGYSGTLCQTLVNNCASLPCSNSGTCTNMVNGYICTCVSGYSGNNCQTNINECTSVPCMNGGSCIDGVNSFSCNCVIGYSGTYCQTLIDDCASQPCNNGGTCVDIVDGYVCQCTIQFFGSTCSYLVLPSAQCIYPSVAFNSSSDYYLLNITSNAFNIKQSNLTIAIYVKPLSQITSFIEVGDTGLNGYASNSKPALGFTIDGHVVFNMDIYGDSGVTSASNSWLTDDLNEWHMYSVKIDQVI